MSPLGFLLIFSRKQVLVKRQSSAGSNRPPRGSDLPPAVVTTTTTTTTTTIAAVSSPGGRGGSSNRTGSGGAGGGNGGGGSSSGVSQTLLSSPSQPPTAKRPSSAGSTRRGDASGGAKGDSSNGSSGSITTRQETAAAGTAGPRVGQVHRSAAAGEGEGGRGGAGGGDEKSRTAALVAAVTTPVVTGTLTPTGAAEVVQDCRRVWDVRAFEALSSRDKGLLPNEHPVQMVALQVCISACQTCVVFLWAVCLSSPTLCRRSLTCRRSHFVCTMVYTAHVCASLARLSKRYGDSAQQNSISPFSRSRHATQTVQTAACAMLRWKIKEMHDLWLPVMSLLLAVSADVTSGRRKRLRTWANTITGRQ